MNSDTNWTMQLKAQTGDDIENPSCTHTHSRTHSRMRARGGSSEYFALPETIGSQTEILKL